MHTSSSDAINSDGEKAAIVTRLVLSEDKRYYFIGYEDGLVQAISTVDLSLAATWSKGQEEKCKCKE